MPLPDERPRQSVANLIGRFEQQVKRQASPALPVVLRSASVSSQIAGDAAKEEVKEKKDWPPKPPPSTEIKPLPSSIVSSKPPVVAPQPIPDPPPPPAAVPTTPIPASPEPAKSPPPRGKVVATSRSAPSAGTRRVVTSPPKTRSPVANSSSTKSLASTPPKSLLHSSVSQPLRSQHTAHSVPSMPSTKRQARSVPRTAPSTPSRPKSSAGHNKAVQRPKTPSSGLFAPTAASLARSRNAPPPPPPPVKKVTLSSDAAERLSKPTAASLSKARAPAPTVPSPAKVVKSTSTSAPTSSPRGSKLRAGRTLVNPKEVDAMEEFKSGPASVASEPSRDSDHIVADRIENGHQSDVESPEQTHGSSDIVIEAAHAGATDEQVLSHSEEEADEHPAENDPAPNLPEAVAHEHEQVCLKVEEEDEPAAQVVGNGGVQGSGNDIEDLVNLLEGASKPRPQSIVSIPDEDGEILDEY